MRAYIYAQYNYMVYYAILYYTIQEYSGNKNLLKVESCLYLQHEIFNVFFLIIPECFRPHCT